MSFSLHGGAVELEKGFESFAIHTMIIVFLEVTVHLVTLPIWDRSISSGSAFKNSSCGLSSKHLLEPQVNLIFKIIVGKKCATSVCEFFISNIFIFFQWIASYLSFPLLDLVMLISVQSSERIVAFTKVKDFCCISTLGCYNSHFCVSTFFFQLICLEIFIFVKLPIFKGTWLWMRVLVSSSCSQCCLLHTMFQAGPSCHGVFHLEVTISLVEISGIVKITMFQVANLL